MKKLLILLSIIVSLFADAQTQRQKDSIMLVNGGACLFIDFDGQSVIGSGWGVDIYAAASAINGNTSRMDSVITLAQEMVWPFNVVATRDSTLFFLARSDRRKRVINTPTYEWWGAGYVGISQQASMYKGNATPSFIFEIIDFTAKERAICCVHEFAHTLGLLHMNDGGVGSSQTGVKPIMAISLTPEKNITLWWKGTNEEGNEQDDISIIALGGIRNNGVDIPGIGGRVGDAGNTFTTAKRLIKDQSFYAFIGVRDSDYYKIEIPSTQTVSITVTPWSNGASNANANLDAAIDLYDDSRSLVTSSTNTTVLNASVSQSLTAGTYYIKVRGDRGNANNPTAYGFMGHYTLTYTY